MNFLNSSFEYSLSEQKIKIYVESVTNETQMTSNQYPKHLFEAKNKNHAQLCLSCIVSNSFLSKS